LTERVGDVINQRDGVEAEGAQAAEPFERPNFDEARLDATEHKVRSHLRVAGAHDRIHRIVDARSERGELVNVMQGGLE
jgi:hypothetical protein